MIRLTCWHNVRVGMRPSSSELAGVFAYSSTAPQQILARILNSVYTEYVYGSNLVGIYGQTLIIHYLS
jgi:hypothetical protein